VEYLANAGFDPQYGARPLRRAIQRLLEDEISERLLSGDIEPGQRVEVGLEDGRLTFDVDGATDQRRREEVSAPA
jgi:ATP-dependent Clp protease ATP-binding subunit ClpC